MHALCLLAVLPYTEAAIMEVQRYSNSAPVALPHRTQEEIILDGYVIPKDTMIVSNLYSVHHDPRYWKHPERFDPLRFLDANQTLLKPDGFAPFGIGKNMPFSTHSCKLLFVKTQ